MQSPTFLEEYGADVAICSDDGFTLRLQRNEAQLTQEELEQLGRERLAAAEAARHA